MFWKTKVSIVPYSDGVYQLLVPHDYQNYLVQLRDGTNKFSAKDANLLYDMIRKNGVCCDTNVCICWPVYK